MVDPVLTHNNHYRAVGAVGRRPRGTGGPSARWCGGDAAMGEGAGAAGTLRGSAVRKHYMPHRGRSAWVDRRHASFVSAGKSEMSRVQSERVAFWRHCGKSEISRVQLERIAF